MGSLSLRLSAETETYKIKLSNILKPVCEQGLEENMVPNYSAVDVRKDGHYFKLQS